MRPVHLLLPVFHLAAVGAVAQQALELTAESDGSTIIVRGASNDASTPRPVLQALQHLQRTVFSRAESAELGPGLDSRLRARGGRVNRRSLQGLGRAVCPGHSLGRHRGRRVRRGRGERVDQAHE